MSVSTYLLITELLFLLHAALSLFCQHFPLTRIHSSTG